MAVAGSVDPAERSSRDLWVMSQPIASGCESSPFKGHGQQVARFEPSGLVVGVCGRYWLRADTRADLEALPPHGCTGMSPVYYGAGGHISIGNMCMA